MNAALANLNSASMLAASRSAAAQGTSERLSREAANLSSAEDEKIWKVSEDFESVYLNILWKQMKSTIMTDKDSPESSNAMQIFKSMFDEEASKVGAKRREIGLSKLIHDNLVRNMANSAGQRTRQATDI